MDKPWLKKVLVKIEERERAIDEIHKAAENLALHSISDEDLLGLESGKESAEGHFVEIRERYARCSSATEARALYLTFHPGTVNFDFQTENALRDIELGARMRAAGGNIA